MKTKKIVCVLILLLDGRNSITMKNGISINIIDDYVNTTEKKHTKEDNISINQNFKITLISDYVQKETTLEKFINIKKPKKDTSYHSSEYLNKYRNAPKKLVEKAIQQIIYNENDKEFDEFTNSSQILLARYFAKKHEDRTAFNNLFTTLDSLAKNDVKPIGERAKKYHESLRSNLNIVLVLCGNIPINLKPIDPINDKKLRNGPLELSMAKISSFALDWKDEKQTYYLHYQFGQAKNVNYGSISAHKKEFEQYCYQFPDIKMTESGQLVIIQPMKDTKKYFMIHHDTIDLNHFFDGDELNSKKQTNKIDLNDRSFIYQCCVVHNYQ